MNSSPMRIVAMIALPLILIAGIAYKKFYAASPEESITPQEQPDLGTPLETAAVSDDAAASSADSSLSISWSTLPNENTTLVLASTSPTYAAVVMKKADAKVEVVKSMVFLKEKGEERFSLGKTAYDGKLCVMGAASPATLEARLKQWKAGTVTLAEDRCVAQASPDSAPATTEPVVR